MNMDDVVTRQIENELTRNEMQAEDALDRIRGATSDRQVATARHETASKILGWLKEAMEEKRKIEESDYPCPVCGNTEKFQSRHVCSKCNNSVCGACVRAGEETLCSTCYDKENKDTADECALCEKATNLFYACSKCGRSVCADCIRTGFAPLCVTCHDKEMAVLVRPPDDASAEKAPTGKGLIRPRDAEVYAVQCRECDEYYWGGIDDPQGREPYWHTDFRHLVAAMTAVGPEDGGWVIRLEDDTWTCGKCVVKAAAQRMATEAPVPAQPPDEPRCERCAKQTPKELLTQCSDCRDIVCPGCMECQPGSTTCLKCVDT